MVQTKQPSETHHISGILSIWKFYEVKKKLQKYINMKSLPLNTKSQLHKWAFLLLKDYHFEDFVSNAVQIGVCFPNLLEACNYNRPGIYGIEDIAKPYKCVTHQIVFDKHVAWVHFDQPYQTWVWFWFYHTL